jgi:hypothetical protein
MYAIGNTNRIWVNSVSTAHLVDSVTRKNLLHSGYIGTLDRMCLTVITRFDIVIFVLRLKIELIPSNFVHFSDLKGNKYTDFTEPQNALINKSQIPLIFSAASKNLHESIKICRLIGGMGDWYLQINFLKLRSCFKKMIWIDVNQ